MNKSLESIVFINCVKYDRLQELINFAYNGSNADHINLYIDLYPVVRSIYSDQYAVNYSGTMDLVPLLINLCAHYRHFFRYVYNVHTTIYLVAGKNLPEVASMLVPEYNYVMRTRNNGPVHFAMDDMIKTNFEILKIMAPYLPDIHFVQTEFETSLTIGYIINAQEDLSVPNLVITKDTYGLQLISNKKCPVNVIIPLKVNELDEHKMPTIKDVSVILQSSNIKNNWIDFWIYYTKHRNVKLPANEMIDPINFVPVISLSGLSERSLKSLIQFPTIFHMIYQIIGSEASQCSIDTIYNSFDIEGKVPRHIVENRFHCLDIPYQLETLYNSSTEALLMKFENKHDPETVRKICDKYFTNIPISLDKL